MQRRSTEPLLDWRRLAQGNADQRRAWRALESSAVMTILADFTPVLAGTIPIDVYSPRSDLDVICCFSDSELFAERLREAFADHEGFRQYSFRFKGELCVLARFKAFGFTFEVFGQSRPVLEQNAVRHLIAEGRLLQIAGEGARRQVRRLKRGGLSTEAAFALAFGLSGDPYERLLELAGAPEGRLRRLAAGFSNEHAAVRRGRIKSCGPRRS